MIKAGLSNNERNKNKTYKKKMIIIHMIKAGLSNLQFVDLNSTRNLFVLGFSIFFSLVLPKWMAAQQEAGLSPIETGSTTLDSIVTVVLTSSMFIAMLLGFVLDNTMPGTPEERGLVAWQGQHQASQKE